MYYVPNLINMQLIENHNTIFKKNAICKFANLRQYELMETDHSYQFLTNMHLQEVPNSGNEY